MNINPNASELLAIARQTLLDELLPQLPANLRYQTLMVANAMAIAGRECVEGEQAKATEVQQMAAVLEHVPAASAEIPHVLCRAIRQGRFDTPGDEQERLLAALSSITRARLSISNPKALVQ